MSQYTFEVVIPTKYPSTAIDVLGCLVEGFDNEPIKPESIKQVDGSAFNRALSSIKVVFKIDATSEFDAWGKLNHIVKTVINPTLDKFHNEFPSVKMFGIERMRLISG